MEEEDWIRRQLADGYTPEEIKDVLQEKGYDPSIVDTITRAAGTVEQRGSQGLIEQYLARAADMVSAVPYGDKRWLAVGTGAVLVAVLGLAVVTPQMETTRTGAAGGTDADSGTAAPGTQNPHTTGLSHDTLSNVSADDHHARYRDTEAVAAVGNAIQGRDNISIAYDETRDRILIGFNDTNAATRCTGQRYLAGDGNCYRDEYGSGADGYLPHDPATSTVNLGGHAITDIDWAGSDAGAGSGLDADRLDAYDGSYYKQDLADVLNQANTAATDLNMSRYNITATNELCLGANC
jgi:hypothetical protein